MKKSCVSMLLVLLLTVVALAQFTLMDDLGRLVTFEKPVERIVVAAPAISDFLVVLDAKDKVVGVTNWDNHITDVEKIGNLVPLNIEKILSLKPDVVFLTGGFQEPEVYKLEKFGIKAFVLNANSFNDVFRDLILVGNIIGKGEEAKKLAKELKDKVLSIAKETFTWKDKPKVLYASVYNNISQIWTCGTGSFLNEVIAYAGGINVAAPYTGNNGWFMVGPEFVIKEDPDIIIVPGYYPGDNTAKNIILSAEQFKDLKAVKNNRIFVIDGNKASQPNTKLVELLQELYTIFKENRK